MTLKGPPQSKLLYKFVKIVSQQFAQGNPNLQPEISFLVYYMYWIFPTAYEISLFYSHLTQRVTIAEDSTAIVFNDN